MRTGAHRSLFLLMTQTYLPAPSTIVRWNLRQLYLDIFWFGVLAGSILAFISVYAARLGATSIQIGLLSAGPAVVNLLITLPAGQWLEGKPLIRAAFISSLGQRAGYLLLVFLPFVFHQTIQVWAIILLTLMMSISGTLLAISFNAMYAEVVPVEWRGKAAGWRNGLVAISMTITTLMSGYILDQVIFPLNYQIVFLIGTIGALMSSYHLSRVRRPGDGVELHAPAAKPNQENLKKVHWSDWLLHQVRGRRGTSRLVSKPLLRLDVLRGPFGLFMAGCLAFYAFQYFSLPVFPLFYVNELNLTDGEISLGSSLFNGTMMLGSLFLYRLSARYGHRKVMLMGVSLFGLFPLLLGFARDASLFYLACAFSGPIVALINVGLINRLMERVPDNDRPAHMALHNLALNLGVLTGSLLGPVVADWMGLRDVLYLSAGLRLLAALLLWRWG